MAEIRINATGALKLYDSDDSNYVALQSAGTVSSNITWTLPSADGSSGQVLSTNGSGTLSWATASSADPASADGDTLGTASLEWSDLFLADGGIIKFGNDQDTLLTHTDGTGLTLNSTNKLCFNDASQFVQGSSATVLSIGATDEIDLTATAVDLNGTLDVSGQATFSDGTAGAPSISNTGDTNCGIFFSAADTIAFSAGGTSQVTISDGAILPVADDDIDLGASGTQFKDGYFDGTLEADVLTVGGVELGELSTVGKVWIQFNGTGTIAIQSSFNVSSISDAGTGQYAVNFSTALGDDDFAAVTGGVKGSYGAGNRINDLGTAICKVDNWSTSAYTDSAIITLIILGNSA